MIAVTRKLLKRGQYTRPGLLMPRVAGVVLHWTGNAGAGIDEHRRWFNSIRDSGPYASYHYMVDKERIVQLIPEGEIAYHAGPSGHTHDWVRERLGGLPNWRTLAVSMVHDDEHAIPEQTRRTAAELCADIMARYGLNTDTVLRHYDCTGKACPRPFLDRVKWVSFLEDVARIDGEIEGIV